MRVLVLFFLSALCLAANAQSLKIGFIDTEQVIASLTQYKNSVDEISREFEPRKQELLDLFKHIELIRANIKLNKKNSTSDSDGIALSKLRDLEKSFEKETEFWQKGEVKIDYLNDEIPEKVDIRFTTNTIEESNSKSIFIIDNLNYKNQILNNLLFGL